MFLRLRHVCGIPFQQPWQKSLPALYNYQCLSTRPLKTLPSKPDITMPFPFPGSLILSPFVSRDDISMAILRPIALPEPSRASSAWQLILQPFLPVCVPRCSVQGPPMPSGHARRQPGSEAKASPGACSWTTPKHSLCSPSCSKGHLLNCAPGAAEATSPFLGKERQEEITISKGVLLHRGAG